MTVATITKTHEEIQTDVLAEIEVGRGSLLRSKAAKLS
jgi:hypothetical protein